MEFENLKIGEICTSLNKFRVPVSKMERSKLEKIFPYYGAQGIIDYIDNYIFDGTYLLVAEDGANLIERKYKIANIASGKYWVNNHAHILNFKTIEDLYYVYCYLNNNDISAYITGSAQPKLNSSNLMQISIRWPEKNTRYKISRILSRFDQKIEINNKIIENLESQAQAIFKSWFVDFEPFQDGNFVESELGSIPEGWEVVKLKNLSSIVTGKTPSTKIKEYYGDDLPFITIPDMHNKTYITSTERYLSEKGKDSQVKKTIPKDSICVSCIATVGLVVITSEDSQTNQQINSLIPNDKKYLYYLYSLLQSKYDYLNAIGSSGSTTKNINKRTFENISILNPNYESISKFYDICKPIFDSILNYQVQNDKLSQTRDTLLPKLMSGEIDVSNIKIDEDIDYD